MPKAAPTNLDDALKQISGTAEIRDRGKDGVQQKTQTSNTIGAKKLEKDVAGEQANVPQHTSTTTTMREHGQTDIGNQQKAAPQIMPLPQELDTAKIGVHGNLASLQGVTNAKTSTGFSATAEITANW